MPAYRYFLVTKTIQVSVAGASSAAEAHQLANEETDVTRWQETTVTVSEYGVGERGSSVVVRKGG